MYCHHHSIDANLGRFPPFSEHPERANLPSASDTGTSKEGQGTWSNTWKRRCKVDPGEVEAPERGRPSLQNNSNICELRPALSTIMGHENRRMEPHGATLN